MLFSNKPQDIKSDLRKSHLETVDERVHRHLRDKYSDITDEDIKNVVVELNIRKNVYEDFLAMLPEEQNQ